jgi:nucleosome assembly protein 1-like 1
MEERRDQPEVPAAAPVAEEVKQEQASSSLSAQPVGVTISVDDLPEKNDILEEEKAASHAIAQSEENKEALNELFELQKVKNQIYLQYLAEMRTLQNKYERLYEPLYIRRSETINNHNVSKFWLTVLKNHPMVSSYITERDEKLLEFLVDIKVVEDPITPNFAIEATFAENPYIENKTLIAKFKADSDGEVTSTECTDIKWRAENFTMKLIKKKKGRKGKAVTKLEKCDSFFNLFINQSLEADMDEDMDEEEGPLPAEEIFDMAQEIRDEIVPNAFMFFLNIKPEDELEDEEGGDRPQAVVDASGNQQKQCPQQ